MSTTQKYVVPPNLPLEMSLEEFRRAGFLQEVNRRFFHPLGLALAMERVDGEPTGRFKIWDGRDDIEGFTFAHWDEGDGERGRKIGAELQRRIKVRRERLGFGLEPLP